MGLYHKMGGYSGYDKNILKQKTKDIRKNWFAW